MSDQEEEFYEGEEGVEDLQEDFEPSYDEVLAAQKISFQDIMDHITGPVISVIVHVILLAILGTIVVFQPPGDRKDIEVDVTELDVKELEKIPEPPEPPDEREVEVEVEIDRPDVQSDVQVEVEDVAVEDAQVDVKMPDLLSVKPSDSALKLPGVFAMRSGAGRRRAIKLYGGSARSEKSVMKGLYWLKDHQNEDGSWGDARENVKASISALALLAFLAHGETPASAKFGTTVLKAIRNLIGYVDRCSAPRGVGSRGYEHGMVSYALAEAFALTKIPMVEKANNKAMRILIDGQNKNGSFNYGYNNSGGAIDPKTGKVTGGGRIGEPRSDLSVAGWNYQALKASFAGGCAIEGIEAAIDRSVEVGLKKTHLSPSGGFSYSGFSTGGSGASHTMSGVGTLCLQLLGAGKSKQCQDGLKWLTTNEARMTCDWKNKIRWHLYAWYYQTQAVFQGYSGKGKIWKTWNKQFTKSLMREQEKDGHWSTPTEKYHKPKKGEKAGHGENAHTFGTEENLNVYATSLCTLMLEVYYRYLPTFKVVKQKKAPVEGEGGDSVGETEDDLGLKIE